MLSLTHQERSGIFRGLLMRPAELSQTVNQCWTDIPDPREQYAARVAEYCGFRSKGRKVFYNLFRLMMSEHKAYLENIPSYVHQMFRNMHPNIPEREISKADGFAMAMDVREQMAWHLAANRAEARLLITPIPSTLNGCEEPWMNISKRRKKNNLIVLSLYQRDK